MKIYLDNCCLNRPFDSQEQIRIHFEFEATKTIISLCARGEWKLLVSSATIFENEKNQDNEKKVILI